MLTCNHWIPTAPFFFRPLKRFATPGGKFVRSRLRNPEIDIFSRLWRRRGLGVFSSKDGDLAGDTAPLEGFLKKRKIVEHILLLQAKVDLSDADEKDMLDFLYSSQYHISGIIAISLGRVEDRNMDNVTHAVYMRFQRREDLARFSSNSHFLEVLKEHVFPYCYVCPDMDYFLSILNPTLMMR